MKFEKPRFFVTSDGCCATFYDDDHGVCSCGSGIGFWETQLNPARWVEVSQPPPTDVTKLDTAGVFHAEPVKVERTPGQVCREGYLRNTKESVVNWSELNDWQRGLWEAAAQAVLADANATIAELRRRVAELEKNEAEVNDLCDKFQRLTGSPVNMTEHIEPVIRKCNENAGIIAKCYTELRRQLQAAWMRNDLTTADRIADLIGEKRPSEHESDGAK